MIAFGIIAMVVFTSTMAFLFKAKSFVEIMQGYRFWWSFPAALLAVILFSASVSQKCFEEAITPKSYLAVITMCCVFCLVFFVDKKNILLPICIFLLGIAMLLQSQFDALVYESDNYYAIDAHTHKLVAKGCSDQSSVGIVVIELWHTWFTGIYKVAGHSESRSQI